MSDRIAEIEARLQAADKPETWEAGSGGGMVSVFGPRGKPGEIVAPRWGSTYGTGRNQDAENMILIAHAGRDLRYLLDENARLRTALEATTRERDEARAGVRGCECRADEACLFVCERDAARAEVASLRAQPRVHPLAWASTVAEAGAMQVAARDDETLKQAALRTIDAWDRWYDAGCPLLATDDDATTPTVGEPK